MKNIVYLFIIFVSTLNAVVISKIPVSRENFKLQKNAFDAKFLNVKYVINSPKSIRGSLFVKDKDGNFFQTDKVWDFVGDSKEHILQIPIDKRNKIWRSYANNANWCAINSIGIFEVGLSLWGEATGEIIDFYFSGKRDVEKLKITALEHANIGKIGEIYSAKFQLSREYFNPFNPDEIKVDVQWQDESGNVVTFPAFFTQKYDLQYAITQESSIPLGNAFWQFRYLPRSKGINKFRLIVKDLKNEFISEWETLVIKDNKNFKGTIQVSKNNPKFFEFENGELFFPVGINIHTNVDYRSEIRLNLFPLADMGLRDYELYFKKCKENNINTVEVWMASWTFALEWSSSRYGYNGVGRYNLANADKLDRLFNLAEKYGIYINLVFDNHGKFANTSNQEWFENPFNKNSKFAIADGGFINDSDNLFANNEFNKFYKYRNRYIAARYGQHPNIFAIELWSEVDLVLNFRQKSYYDNSAISWHSEMIKHYQKHTPIRNLITTHVCGDIRNNLRFIKLWEIPEVTHLVGDAYRSHTISMYEQMRRQKNLLNIKKAALITEFGGPSGGTAIQKLEADIHSGLWSSIFKQQSGAPFLWWHDFVILKEQLYHYKGFSKFIEGIDFRNDKYQSLECKVTAFVDDNSREKWERELSSMVLFSDDEIIGWAFNNERMFIWEKREYCNYFKQSELYLPIDFQGGLWCIDFYDTFTGNIVNSKEINITDNSITLPDFEDDIAFKMRRIK